MTYDINTMLYVDEVSPARVSPRHQNTAVLSSRQHV